MVKGYYDPSDSSSLCGLLKLLCTWNGMPKLVMTRSAWWLLLSVEMGLLSTRILYAKGIWTVPLPLVEWKSVTAVTSLLTFFIVFYGGSMYSRYQAFYGHCVGLGGNCMNWVSLVRNYLPGKTVRWNCSRMVVATLHVLYFSLNEPAPGEPDIGDEEWEIMRGRHLLTMAEIDILKTYGGYKPFLPLVWAMQEVEAALKSVTYEGAPKGPELAALIGAFRGIAFEMRGHCGQINNWLKQPVPYPYFQFLTLLLIVDLILIAYGLTNMEFHWALTLVIYVVILSSFIGLKEVAVAMSDPFGEDDIDFDTNDMLKKAYENAVACLKDDHTPAPTALSDLGNPLLASANGSASKLPTVTSQLSSSIKLAIPAGYPPGTPKTKPEALL